MKSTFISLLFIFVFHFGDYSAAQNFQTPSEEIVKKYLGISGEELLGKCNAKDKCLASKGVDLENGKKTAGENLINFLVNEAKKLPSVSESDWNRLTRDFCQTSVFFETILQLTISNGGKCLSTAEIPSPDNVKKMIKEYIEIYCSRVKDLSKRKFQASQNLQL